MESKKGVSPVVATVLLITLAVIAGVIIFIWAQSAVQEETTKFNEPIKNVCAEATIDVSLVNDQLDVQNLGTRASILTVVLRDVDGDLNRCDDINLSPGQVRTLNTDAECGVPGNEVEAAIPVVYDDQNVEYNCEEQEQEVF